MRHSNTSKSRIVASLLLGITSLTILSIFYSDAIVNRERASIAWFSIAGITFVGVLAFLAVQLLRHKQSNALFKEPVTPGVTRTKSEYARQDPLRIGSIQILWIEKELLRLNKEIHGEERPPGDPEFLQRLPQSFLNKEILSSRDVEEFASYLVQETRKRIGKMEIPFRKPKVEFTKLLPNNEPGHIEFGWDETIIRIHPKYQEDTFGLAAVLCHELAHFILDHNGFRKDDTNENERLTDLFVFKCGQGLIYLQGILDADGSDDGTTTTILGYLSTEEMAYAHVRFASQVGFEKPAILPPYYRGRQFAEVQKACEFLQLQSGKKGELAEIILCPSNHVLRISSKKKAAKIRCPKCNWQDEVWIHRKDRESALMGEGVRAFECGKFEEALAFFRQAQKINKTNSEAYCWASRTLKQMGKHQDAIRELRKLLTISPNDAPAQAEMRKLI